MSKVDLLQLYANRMGEMKTRMVRIEGLVADFPGLADSTIANEDGPALEEFALQFRKVLELIAFSGMIANKAIYEVAHNDFVRHAYPSKKVAGRLSKLHPRWFPEHIELVHDSRQPQLAYAQQSASLLTPQYWQKPYDAMGTLLHIGNPFAGRVQVASIARSRRCTTWSNGTCSRTE
ncbi:hypothetical protein [Ramlibacter alkalitolerans]|uniref:Uncharacterized protein n=1 Tax=Ramlibacter alkalitolerans TaxID=2039631 RepID=A0ABS1JT56_9BURK|nr:hypothetical protein [Ramlibacter alkalitolerans]MBL0427459.1 hypothetical protein [Ramlibacter alkalitolerans]